MIQPVDLPEYRCHKVVRAGRIIKLDITASDSAYLAHLDLGDGRKGELLVPAKVFVRGFPRVGDFIVVYEGGKDREYVSWSPALEFQQGYTLLTEVG